MTFVIKRLFWYVPHKVIIVKLMGVLCMIRKINNACDYLECVINIYWILGGYLGERCVLYSGANVPPNHPGDGAVI